jgi:putative oxidoreductase
MTLYSYFEQKLNRLDLGLLVIRVVFGLFILNAGIMKLLGGKEMLTGVGGSMAVFGIHFAPLFWGLLAALTETLGGVCLILGVFFRPAMLLLVFTMVVATVVMWGSGPSLASMGDFQKFIGNVMPPMTFLAAFLGLLFTGPGKYAMHLKGGGGSKSAKE